MRTGTLTHPVDAAIAVFLAVLAQLEVWAPHLVPGVPDTVTDRPVLAVTALAATLPLAVRRRFPLGVLLTVLVALVLQQALATPTEGLTLLVAGMLAAYSSSAYAPLPRAALLGRWRWASASIAVAVASCSARSRLSARASASSTERCATTIPSSHAAPSTTARKTQSPGSLPTKAVATTTAAPAAAARGTGA
jgi:hypothetical protein